MARVAQFGFDQSSDEEAMNDDVRAIVLGVVSSIVASALIFAGAFAWRRYRRRAMKEDLEFLRLERQHLEAMKRSGVEMNRSSYRSLFFSLFLFALAEAIVTGLTYAGAAQVGRITAMAVWILAAVATFKYFRRYENLKNYSEALKRIDEKIEHLERRQGEHQS
jgi:hypothetical protein